MNTLRALACCCCRSDCLRSRAVARTTGALERGHARDAEDARVQLADGCELVLAQPRFEGGRRGGGAWSAARAGKSCACRWRQIRRLETRQTENAALLANVVLVTVVVPPWWSPSRGHRPRVSTVCSSVRVDRRSSREPPAAAPTTAERRRGAGAGRAGTVH